MSILRTGRTALIALLAGVVLTATALGTAETLAWRASQRLAAHAGSSRLETTLAVQTLLERERTRELELRAGILANDSAFIAYVTQALTASAIPGTRIDTASILDQLLQRKRELGLDLAAVLDPRGRLVVAAGRMPALRGQPAADSMVRQVLASQRPAIGLWPVGAHLEQVALVPLVRGNTVEALLLAGRSVDARFARALAAVAGTDVALVASDGQTPQVLTSTLAPGSAYALSAALVAQPALLTPSGDILRSLPIDGRSRAVAVRPLFGASRTADLVILAPPAAIGPLWRALSLPLLAGAAMVLALLGAGALMLQRRLLLPLQRLSGLVERAAGGDYELRTSAVRGGAIVARLASACDRLLTGVRLRLDQRGSATPLQRPSRRQD